MFFILRGIKFYVLDIGSTCTQMGYIAFVLESGSFFSLPSFGVKFSTSSGSGGISGMFGARLSNWPFFLPVSPFPFVGVKV